MTTSVEVERERRERIWQELQVLGSVRSVTTSMLEKAGVRPANTGQGVFRDYDATKNLASSGVTLSLLDIGSSYPDSFDAEAGEYHYPCTKRPGDRDQNEIAATKAAKALGLPVFVVLEGPTTSTREVRRGFVDSWDDRRGVFLISFSAPSDVTDATPNILHQASAARTRTTVRFRYAVLSRCDGQCVVCNIAIDQLLVAENLSQNVAPPLPDDGITLCRNHSAAFTRPSFLFGIRPATFEIVMRGGVSAMQLGITKQHVASHCAARPEATAQAWRAFATSTGVR